MIDQSFWSDPDIERAKAGVKLAALWLITNSQTSLLGICGASDSRFKFETGLPIDALESALEALPRAFKRFGSVIFVRNYVRHQFGTGEKLIRNNFFVALKSLFLSVKDDELKACVLSEYPEFSKALQSPSEGLTKPKDVKERKEKVSTEKSQIPDIPPELLEIEGFTEGWAQFAQHRKEIKKPLTPLAAKRVLNSLVERPGDVMDALETAIRRSWQGFEWAWFDRDRPKNGNGTKGGGLFLR